MLTEQSFYKLLSRHESERVEFTTSTNNMDKFCEAVCAFANDLADSKLPGYLLIGVDDKGAPSGLKVTDELMRNLSSTRNVLQSPHWAIRELMMNALMHRDYQSNAPVRLYEFSDHLEITNPGFLYGESRPENFPRINDYRNPIIAESMKTLGYVNKFSYGVLRVTEELEENRNGKPAFNLGLLTAFQVTVEISESVKALGYYLEDAAQKSSQKNEETTQKTTQKDENTTQKNEETTQKNEETTQKNGESSQKSSQKSILKSSQKSSQKILALIKKNNAITIKELMEITGWSDNWVKRNIANLRQQGLLRRVGPDKGGHWEIIEKH